MQLCPAADLANHDDVDELAQWAQNSFDYLVSNACFTLKTVIVSTLGRLSPYMQQQQLQCVLLTAPDTQRSGHSHQKLV